LTFEKTCKFGQVFQLFRYAFGSVRPFNAYNNHQMNHSPRKRTGGASRRRRAHYLALGLALCELAALQPALAQTTQGTPAASPAPSTTPATTGQATDGKVQAVTVVGERQNNRIDRQVYDVKSDVSSSNGSAADALGNVPSVGVDPDGTVSLRGNTNVQILVDGKPSAMLQGEGRGAMLQAMPAEDIDSIEVINNPGAEFGNEGGGGPILNLVMKRSRRPGGQGVANANYGTAGRYNAQVGGGYNSGRWGMQGGVNVRHNGARPHRPAYRRRPANELVRHQHGPEQHGRRPRPVELQPGPGRHAGSECRLPEAGQRQPEPDPLYDRQQWRCIQRVCAVFQA
jgi:hypothetical protein